MPIGAKYWDAKTAYYVQTNNSIEAILRDSGQARWLETCGPTAAVNCLAALGHDVEITTPGGWHPQPEDVLTLYLNDPGNWNDLSQVRVTDILLENRIPQYYPLAVYEVFGVIGEFVFTNSFDFIAEKLVEHKAVQLCFESPGHYVAAVAYDPEFNEIIYNDPWPRTGRGFNTRLTHEEYLTNVKGWCIIYV